MAASEQSETLWNVSVVSNKSWVELVEDEEDNLARVENVVQSTVSQVQMRTVDRPSEKSLIEPRQVPVIITEEESLDTASVTPLDAPTYANILKTSVSPDKAEGGRPAPPKDFLHEDISLTGHIEGFQLSSPCKTFKTPTKAVDPIVPRSSPRNLKRKILEETTVPDELLMPSPGKVPRSSERPLLASPLNLNQSTNEGSGKKSANPRKRLRDRDLHTPPHRRYERAPPELETNEEVLARRQKQIDYGKNTVGYERYRQLVPKDCRKSVHPKTPPMHLKYSRRAWEGLVRIWRQRLHFWDPPSEGGGDPACLEAEISDMSDVGSTDGSLPSTPVQDMKRRQVYMSPSEHSASSRIKHHRANRPAEALSNVDDDLDKDCQPLSPE